MAVQGFADPPDEVHSREAGLPARPHCGLRSLCPKRARVLAGVRSRAPGPGGYALSSSPRSEAAVQPGLAKVCHVGEAEALR